MRVFAVLAFAASLVAAQSKIGFTSAPAGTISAGSPVKITWSGGTGEPVTIILKQGEPDDLSTVAIITGNTKGTSFTWTPDTSLVSANNYALEITQGLGVDDTNYSGEFALSGGASSSASSSASVTPGPIVASGTTGIVTVTSSNTTQTVAYTVVQTGTGASASGTGTGFGMPRNTTFVHASTKTATVTHTGGLSAGTITPTSSGPASSTAASSSGLAGQMGAQVGAVGMGLLAVAAFL